MRMHYFFAALSECAGDKTRRGSHHTNEHWNKTKRGSSADHYTHSLERHILTSVRFCEIRYGISRGISGRCVISTFAAELKPFRLQLPGNTIVALLIFVLAGLHTSKDDDLIAFIQTFRSKLGRLTPKDSVEEVSGVFSICIFAAAIASKIQIQNCGASAGFAQLGSVYDSALYNSFVQHDNSPLLNGGIISSQCPSWQRLQRSALHRF